MLFVVVVVAGLGLLIGLNVLLLLEDEADPTARQ